MRDFIKVSVLSTLMTLGVVGAITLVPKDAQAKCRIPFDASGNPILPIPSCALPPQPTPTDTGIPPVAGDPQPQPTSTPTPTSAPEGTLAPMPGN